jgi:hypothetical protein
MNILLAPLHINLNPSYGSEGAWAYNIMSRLAENFNIWIDVVCGETTNLNLPPNVRIFELGFSRGDLLNRSLFTLRFYNLARKLVKNVEI